ncbi:MAG: DNA translocase FtsK 4TM domain-containing protein [Myxococcales bacterium]|jgi:S-DNA-T family DNA segregation ATPase FtsK/SpoIIIE
MDDTSRAPRHEVLGILAAAATLLFGLSLWSYDLRGGQNWVGPVGEGVAGFFVSAFGLGAIWLPVELLLATVHLFRIRERSAWVTHAASMLVILLVGCALLHLALPDATVFGGHLPGGMIGEILAEVMRSLVGPAGAYVICVSALLINLVLRTSVSVVHVTRRAGRRVVGGGRSMLHSARDGLQALADAWREAKQIEAEERARETAAGAPKIVESAAGEELVEPRDLEESPDGDAEADVEEEPDDDADHDDYVTEAEDEEPEPAPRRRRGRKASPGGPTIVAPRAEALAAPRQKEKPGLSSQTESDGKTFMLPPTTLLTEAPESTLDIDEATLRANAARLVEKLEAYGVKGRVDEIHPGPVVTMYEFEPQSGTKISKIAGLADDLAMALAAEKVRIVAPIPGKARVGFELPNSIRQTVHLRDLLEDQRWSKHDGLLPVAFGKDIAGQSVYGDLAKMPHVLVAGATGSGKSVGLNVMLTSLLMKKAPEQVRLLMIDPKVVELAVFDGIPHMLLPVVTDMKKASLALRWAVDEMERRYQLFADVGARNVVSYNAKVDRVLKGDMTVEQFMPKRKGKVVAKDHHGQDHFLDPEEGESPDAEDFMPERLPCIVVVVDEFADLMMVAAKDVEAAIARLAQKARAAGIHVILATQRPSVDVITGMIKANFPSRIGFKVSQREDSKTILGRNGAEHLLGMGDMLALMPGSSDLKRIHCAYTSEDDVKAVCDFLRLQGEPVYDDNILKPREDDDGDALGGGNSDDPTYDKAVAVVAQAGYCSISHIQRNLSIGYNKAAKLVERMEKEGVVGPPSGKAGGRREVFIEAR